MKRIKYLLFIMSLVAAVGFAYATTVLKSMPETFDWDEDDE